MATKAQTTEISSTDLALAEALMGRGNSADAVAAMLGVAVEALSPIQEKADAENELRQLYEKGDPSRMFGDMCQEWLEENPDNILDLNADKPYLSVSGLARRYGWNKGQFKSTVSSLQGSGRPRVDNSDERLEEAARNAKVRADTDKRKNLKLCIVEAMADIGVTDINGVVKACQSVAPEHWKPRS